MHRNYKPPLTPGQESTQLAQSASKVSTLSQIGENTRAGAILETQYRQAERRGVSIGSAMFALAKLLAKWGHND